MMYDKYCLAVLYRLHACPMPVASLYCNTSQQIKLNKMLEAGIIRNTPAGYDMTTKGKKLYKLALALAEAEGCDDYLAESRHIDERNNIRKALLRKRYHERGRGERLRSVGRSVGHPPLPFKESDPGIGVGLQ